MRHYSHVPAGVVFKSTPLTSALTPPLLKISMKPVPRHHSSPLLQLMNCLRDNANSPRRNPIRTTCSSYAPGPKFISNWATSRGRPESNCNPHDLDQPFLQQWGLSRINFSRAVSRIIKLISSLEHLKISKATSNSCEHNRIHKSCNQGLQLISCPGWEFISNRSKQEDSCIISASVLVSLK